MTEDAYESVSSEATHLLEQFDQRKSFIMAMVNTARGKKKGKTE